jgi:hypothetical protein
MKFIKLKASILSILFIIYIINVFAISSDNYNIDASITSSGGGHINSSSYSSDAIVGTISGVTNSTNYYNYLGFFYGGGSSSAESNSAPVISFVSDPGSPIPAAGSTTAVTFWFIANDSNTANDLVNSTSTATLTASGETTRANSPCTGMNDPTTNSRNFSCTVNMYYYDAATTWTINVTVNDSANNKAVNDTRTFSYQGLLHINLTSNTLSWTGQAANTFNRSADSSINLSNIGNLVIRNITVKGFELLKDGTDSVNKLGASNFSVTNYTGRTCAVGLKTTLSNNSEVNMTLNMTTYVYNKGVSNTSLYYCLDIPNVLTGTYNTTNQWITTGNQ